MRVVLDQFIKLFATADSKESSSEAARDTNEGNEGVINYPAGTLLHKSQNQWARQRPVCKHTHSLSAQHQSLSLSPSLMVMAWVVGLTHTYKCAGPEREG